MMGPGCAGEPSREEYRDEITEAVCDRYDECGRIGSGRDYNSMDDCRVDMRNTFNDLWPSSECDQGRINPDRYDICYSRAKSLSCNNMLGETLWFGLNCNANQVCIDPAE
jgi:hypothetical protein